MVKRKRYGKINTKGLRYKDNKLTKLNSHWNVILLKQKIDSMDIVETFVWIERLLICGTESNLK